MEKPPTIRVRMASRDQITHAPWVEIPMAFRRDDGTIDYDGIADYVAARFPKIVQRLAE